MSLDQNVVSLQPTKFQSNPTLSPRWPLLAPPFDFALWLLAHLLLKEGMRCLFYINLHHLERTQPQVPTIWLIKRVVIIQVSNIEGRRNVHVWWKSNHIGIVVDLLSILKWPILLVLQFIGSTDWKLLLPKVDQYQIPNKEDLLTPLLISSFLRLSIWRFKFLPNFFLHSLNAFSHIFCSLAHS